MAEPGFKGITENKPADSGPMGMIARKKQEMEDAMRAISGSGQGSGGGAKQDDDDTYLDIAGRRHKKGSLD